LSSVDSSFVSGTPFQQWLAFFNMEEILKGSAAEDGLLIKVDKSFFSAPAVVKALEVMKSIADTDFSKYREKAQQQRAMEPEADAFNTGGKQKPKKRAGEHDESCSGKCGMPPVKK